MLKSISLRNDIEILPETKLPKEINLDNCNNVTLEGDLSSSQHLIIENSNNIDLIGVTEYPKEITVNRGKIPDGADLSKVEQLNLSGEFSIGENVKLGDNTKITLKNAVISKDFDFTKYKNLSFEGIVSANDPESLQRILQSEAQCIYVEKSNVLPNMQMPSDKAIIIIDEKTGKTLSYMPNEKAKKDLMSAFQIENEELFMKEANVVPKEEFSQQSGITLTNKETKAVEKTEVSHAEENAGTSKKSLKEKMSADSQRAQKVAAETTSDAVERTVQHISTKENQTNVHSKTTSNLAAVDRKFDNVMDNFGAKLNNNKAGRLAMKMEKVGAVPVAAIAAGGMLAYEEYKQTGDLKEAGKVFAKSMKTPAIQGAAMVTGTQVGVKGVEKVTSHVVRKKAEKTVSKAVAKRAGKIAGKAVGKSVMKKIPFISAGFGAYFAYERAKEGDWKGACGEALSGIAGCFPGLGTVASTAIDVGLAGRDIHNSLAEAENAQQPQEVALNDEQKLAQAREKSQEELMHNPNAERKEHTPAKKTTVNVRTASQDKTHTA